MQNPTSTIVTVVNKKKTTKMNCFEIDNSFAFVGGSEGPNTKDTKRSSKKEWDGR